MGVSCKRVAKLDIHYPKTPEVCLVLIHLEVHTQLGKHWPTQQQGHLCGDHCNLDQEEPTSTDCQPSHQSARRRVKARSTKLESLVLLHQHVGDLVLLGEDDVVLNPRNSRQSAAAGAVDGHLELRSLPTCVQCA